MEKIYGAQDFDYWHAKGGMNANQEIGDPIGEPIGEPGVWHREYFDRFIRDERHFQNAVNYIHQNPVKAGLVEHEQDWVWSSAFAGFNHPESTNLPATNASRPATNASRPATNASRPATNANQEIGGPMGRPGDEL